MRWPGADANRRPGRNSAPSSAISSCAGRLVDVQEPRARVPVAVVELAATPPVELHRTDDDVLECRSQVVRPGARESSARMIEIQVREDDCVHVAGCCSGGRERFVEGGRAWPDDVGGPGPRVDEQCGRRGPAAASRSRAASPPGRGSSPRAWHRSTQRRAATPRSRPRREAAVPHRPRMAYRSRRAGCVHDTSRCLRPRTDIATTNSRG